MDMNLVILVLIGFLILDRIFVSKEDKKKDEPDMYKVMDMMRMSSLNTNVTFEETKTVLNTMIDEYLDHMYTFENDRTHLIKNKEFPTEWAGIYVYPSQEVQREQISRLKDSVKTNSSETFLNRIRIFYSDAYIDSYLARTAEEKYVKRREESDEKSREFKKTCLENVEKYRKDAEVAEKQDVVNKHKRLNDLLSTFKYTEYLPVTIDEIGDEDRIEGVDTHKLLKGRYMCNKKYYDGIADSIANDNDIVTGIEAYKRVDDKLVAALSKEFGWNEIQADPYVIEASKHDIVEVMMRYGMNPLTNELFGDHDSPSNITETFKGKVYDMDGKRLNNIFYLEETYEKFYGNINEAAITEDISAIFI